MMASTLQATEVEIDVKPRLAPLSESAFDGQQKAIVSAMGMAGKRPNIFAVTIRNPELMVAWNHLGLYMLRGSSLPPRDKERLILVRAGWQNPNMNFRIIALSVKKLV